MISSICESRGIPVTEWISVIAEVILVVNCSPNRSLKRTPFEYMFGNNPGRLPVDYFMQLKRVGEPLHAETVKIYAKINVAEAKQQYKEHYDLEPESDGQHMLRRTRSSNQKNPW